MTPPRRHKTDEEMTPGEHRQVIAGQPRPETDEYREYVRRVHERAGLEPPEGEPRTGDDMTAEDHFHEIRSNR